MAQRRVPLPLGLKSGVGQAQTVSSENLINMYPEVNRGQALSPVHLLGIPGQASFGTIGGTVRGQFKAGATNFAVRDEALYEISSTGTATNRGIIEGSERCDFGYNGQYLHIVADLKSYDYEILTSTLAEKTDPDFLTANSVAVVSNIPVYSRAGTGQIAWPSLTDITAFDALDFAEAETSPDELVAVRESGQELLLFGTEGLEPWRFTGNADQYFEASTSAAAIKAGALCRDAISTVDNAPHWLAKKPGGGLFVARLDGYNAARISTHAIENSIESAANPEEAVAFNYGMRGHEFYVLTIPDHVTWVYDVASQEWSQRVAGQWPITTPEIPQGDWGVRDCAVNEARQVILGKTDGDLYVLDPDSFSQDGAGIVRELTTPPFSLGGVSFTISEIELICMTGVGLSTGTGSVPYVQLSLSHDGGKTWGDAFQEELGPLGEYGWGVRFTRLGRCPGPKGVRARFRCTDAVQFVPIEAFITFEGGSR